MENNLTKNQQILKLSTEMSAYVSKEKNINKLKKNKNIYIQELKKKFKFIDTNYPALFNMILETKNEFDIKKLKQMLGLKEEIDNDRLDYQEASKLVGTHFYKKYVEDTVKKIDKEKE